jgi:uncharacterized membrane protein YeaQ/YmgE (transglycosylase-associated protein family)
VDLIVFALLGGSIGWGLSRTTCIADGRLALTTNILTGISGAVIAGWFLIPLLGGGAQNDFTVTGPIVSLGAVVILGIVAFVRQSRHTKTACQAKDDAHGSGKRWSIGPD